MKNPDKDTQTNSILVHICCSVDSHYFLQCLKESYPDEKIVGYFYNPNIHPYSEYMLRLQDVSYSCEMLGFELIAGEYDLDSWLKATKGYESEPEKGSRCDICFDSRLLQTIKTAKKFQHKKFTTTLLMSPQKSRQKIAQIAQNLCEKFDIEFVAEDYRLENGTARQSAYAKKDKLYRQNYCGCIYALVAQRELQNRFASELISNIGRQVLPNSIEQKLEFFATDRQKHTNITKIKFQNYRLQSAYIKISQVVVASYFLIYSQVPNNQAKTKVEFVKDGIGFCKNGTAVILTIDRLNFELGTDYSDTTELIYSPPTYDTEIALRQLITGISHSSSAIIVMDDMPSDGLFVYCDAVVFDDSKDIFVDI